MRADFSLIARGGTLAVMANLKRKYRRTFIREWREHRDKTLEQVAGRIGMTATNLSKIERGVQPYTQPALEALADALNTTPSSLLIRKPGSQDDIRLVWEELEPEAQAQALAVLKALRGERAA